MFFNKKTPESPPISNEKQYIAWYSEYSKEVAHIRKLYKKNLEKFVVVCTKGALKVLDEYPSGDALFKRIGELSEAYENEMKPMVENMGGLEYCSPELQGAAVSLLMNIYVGIEFLEKKYSHKKAIELFSVTNL